MSRRLAAALTAAWALAAGAGGVATADAAKRMEIAVQDDPVFVHQAFYDRERALAQAKELGATRIRANLSWWRAAGDSALRTRRPRRVPWNWAPYDSLIDAAARHGLRVTFTLTGPVPAWAAADRRQGVYGPRADLYGQFTRAAATHFKRRVDRYALWNEPNHAGWVSPLEMSPALYRDLYVAGYAGVKRADRRAKVLLGELVPYKTERAIAPLQFLRDVTCAILIRAGSLRRKPRLARGPCPMLRADGVAVHPYDYKRAPNRPHPDEDSATIGGLGRLTGTLSALRAIGALRTPSGRTPDIYLTEYGYFNSGKHKIPQAKRATYLVRGYRIAQRNPYVRNVTQYSFVQAPPGFVGSYFDMTLIGRRGNPTPAYTALSQWAQQAQQRGQVARPPAGPLNLPPAPKR